MRALILLATVVSSISFAQSSSYISNPLAMTIVQTLVGPEQDDFSHGRVELYPERQNIPLLGGRTDIRYTYKLQTNLSAPLVFIIPGTGGSARSRSALFISEKLHQLGYQTVTIDSTFSWNFSASASGSGLPGYLPNDAKDLQKVLSTVSKHLVAIKHISPRSYSLVGTSLGGLASLFLEQNGTEFKFEKVVLINPPLDMLYAVKQLDRFFTEGNALSQRRKDDVFSNLISVGEPLLNRQDKVRNRTYMQKTFEALNFTDADMIYLIGSSFRGTLRDVVFASQQVNDLGILKAEATPLHRNERYDEAAQFSFMDYLTEFVYPNIQKEYGVLPREEEVNGTSSMYQFASLIQNNKHIFVIHSADDFVLKPGDAQWLKARFGSRAAILPYGGHCGSMALPEFTTQLNAIFKL